MLNWHVNSTLEWIKEFFSLGLVSVRSGSWGAWVLPNVQWTATAVVNISKLCLRHQAITMQWRQTAQNVRCTYCGRIWSHAIRCQLSKHKPLVAQEMWLSQFPLRACRMNHSPEPHIKLQSAENNNIKWTDSFKRVTWKWSMMVHISPRVSLGFPSAMSSFRILTSLTWNGVKWKISVSKWSVWANEWVFDRIESYSMSLTGQRTKTLHKDTSRNEVVSLCFHIQWWLE